jgi:putative (di)nucleoside polyphosphate hydrolase
LPYKLQKKFWGGKYLGQKQRWYLAEFTGDEAAINIQTENPEFSDWKWISRSEITSAIVAFKRDLYEDVIKEFSEYL